MEAPPPPPVVVPRQAGKRSVTRVAAAFPVASGLLVTSADAVAGAREVQVSDLNGEAWKATLVRSDPKSGLALVRAPGFKLPPLKVAAAFKAGPIKCVSFAPMSIFDLKADLIAGGIRITPDGPVLSLHREPRRSGTPLISGGEVVGVSVADRGANPADLPLATLDDLRAFLADDANAAGPFGVPEQVICELTATVEVQ
jgi:S1-C subfamily serine protease